MSDRVLLFRLIPLVGFALGVSGTASAQLASKSPFTPAQSAAGAAPAASAPIEFRGFMETSEGIQYRIYDPAKKNGVWVKMNEKNSDLGVTVKQHDSTGDTLTVEHQGKTLTLAGRVAKVISSGAAANAVPPPVTSPATANVPAAVTQAVVLNPSPADEAKRLEVVAAEVARRRALREQAAQQVSPAGTTPQVAVPQVVQPAAAQPAMNLQPGARGGGPPPNAPYNQPGRGPVQNVQRR